MSIKEVSTKLTTEELVKFLDVCKNRSCTPSELIKKLILSLIESGETHKKPNESPQNQNANAYGQQAFLQNDPEQPTQGLEEKTVNEIIQKIDKNELNEKDMFELYIKMGEKYEKTGLAKSEEALFRKVHQKLSDKIKKQKVATKPTEKKTSNDIQNRQVSVSVDERLQYF